MVLGSLKICDDIADHQYSWSSPCRMAAALATEPGEGGFPDPEAMLDYGDECLRERAKLGFRAATVATATRRLLADGVIDAPRRGTA
jgi:3-methyladenine DNA glycosylase/8-oxoguanine DNA glycosylase